MEARMAFKCWQIVKRRYCHHANAQVGLEACLIYPAEWLPDQPPRVLGYRCSNAVTCNLVNQPSCVWAGTNPAYDPYAEPQ